MILNFQQWPSFRNLYLYGVIFKYLNTYITKAAIIWKHYYDFRSQ